MDTTNTMTLLFILMAKSYVPVMLPQSDLTPSYISAHYVSTVHCSGSEIHFIFTWGGDCKNMQTFDIHNILWLLFEHFPSG